MIHGAKIFELHSAIARNSTVSLGLPLQKPNYLQ